MEDLKGITQTRKEVKSNQIMRVEEVKKQQS